MIRKIETLFLKLFVYLSIIITVSIAFLIVSYIFIKGIGYINLDLFNFHYNTRNVSLYPALINTISIIGLTLLMSVPLGVFSAIYIVEYAKRDNMFIAVVRLTTETLQGIPSIVYGLFGYLFFVKVIFKTYCLMAGALTLTIMVLPLIMRTTEEALKNVPKSYKDGSYGLGASKLRTIFRIILPAAIPGIFAGIILVIGRVMGETAALIYTAGTVTNIPDTLFGAGSTLSVHMYKLWNEGLNTNQSYATAVILLICVIIINILSDKVASKIHKTLGGRNE